MNPDLVFLKTEAGEEAMRVQTKVMQRNVRTVLILVDGHSNVAQLISKMANPRLTENALIDLERGGFIVRRDSPVPAKPITSNDSVQTQSTAEDQFPELSLLADNTQEIQIVQPEPPLTPTPLVTKPTLSLALPALTPSPPSLPPNEPRPQAKVTPERPALLERIKQCWEAHRLGREISVDFAAARQARMGWKQSLVLGGVASVAVLIFAALFFPLSVFLPDVEAVLSRSIGRQARVSEMTISFYPKPGILLHKVSISPEGKVGDAENPLTIQELLLEPVVTTLFSPVKEFRRAVVQGTVLSIDSLSILPAVSESLRNPVSSVRVKQLRFERTTLNVVGVPVANLEGEVDLVKEGVLGAIRLRSSDRSLAILVTPDKTRIDVELEGFGQRLPSGTLAIDSITAKGYFERGTLTLNSFDLRILDGLIQGSAVIQTAKEINVAGELILERINSGRLCTVFGIGELLSGDLGGQIRFSGRIHAWNEFFQSMSADGDFTMRRGSLRGIDLAEAVRRGAGASVQGGVTNFEQLSGKLRITPNISRFYNLTMNSGLLQSTGSVEIGEKQAISGRMDLQMRGSVNQTRVPIVLGGNLQSPTVQAGRR